MTTMMGFLTQGLMVTGPPLMTMTSVASATLVGPPPLPMTTTKTVVEIQQKMMMMTTMVLTMTLMTAHLAIRVGPQMQRLITTAMVVKIF